MVSISISYTSQEFGVEVKVDELQIDLAYQRATVYSRVRKLVGNFDPALLGELLIFREDDGRLIVGDGWHRVRALRELGIKTVRAEILTGVSNPDRARLFIGRNDRGSIAKLDLDRTKATTGDEDVLAIQMAMQVVGFVYLATEQERSTFRDTATAIRILRAGERSKLDVTGPQHLEHVMRVYAEPYGTDERPQSPILAGLSRLILFDLTIDEERLTKALAGIPPQQLVRMAIDRRLSDSINQRIGIVRAMSRVIVDLYDRGLPAESGKRLRPRLSARY